MRAPSTRSSPRTRSSAARIDVIGFHGQTVLHRPEDRLTVQIGDGAALARATGMPVVYDFRAADVAAGGHGAPLVPVFHRALARSLERPHPIAVLNLGGVANVTFIDGQRSDRLRHRTGQCADRRLHARAQRRAARRGGAGGRGGRVDEAAVERVLKHPFFAQACRNRSTATLSANGSRRMRALRRRARRMAPRH